MKEGAKEEINEKIEMSSSIEKNRIEKNRVKKTFKEEVWNNTQEILVNQNRYKNQVYFQNYYKTTTQKHSKKS